MCHLKCYLFLSIVVLIRNLEHAQFREPYLRHYACTANFPFGFLYVNRRTQNRETTACDTCLVTVLYWRFHCKNAIFLFSVISPFAATLSVLCFRCVITVIRDVNKFVIFLLYKMINIISLIRLITNIFISIVEELTPISIPRHLALGTISFNATRCILP